MPTKRTSKTGNESYQIGIRVPAAIYRQVAKSEGKSTNAKILRLLKAGLKQQKTA